MSTDAVLTLSPEELRPRLVAHMGLARAEVPATPAGVREVLARRRCIQLDPLDRIGANAELVLAARLPGLRRAEIPGALFGGRGAGGHGEQGHAFEHFAKERCLLPASSFPAYRDRAVQTPWWRLPERLKKLDAGLIQAVLDEVRDRGPLTSRELSDHGRVDPIDWSGWKGTSKAGSMALDVLWTRCDVVVAGWSGREKVYDLPERALGAWATAPAPEDFLAWGVRERVRACGLLSRASGPWWSMLKAARNDGTVERLLEAGELVEIGLPGTRRRWLAEPGFLDRPVPEADGRVRILGPLDPLVWDRDLVQRVFDFEYLWEVYKPASKRRWGYYVCPLLHGDRLVGRLEGRVVDGVLTLEQLWREGSGARAGGFPEAELAAAWRAHAAFLGVEAGPLPTG